MDVGDFPPAFPPTIPDNTRPIIRGGTLVAQILRDVASSMGHFILLRVCGKQVERLGLQLSFHVIQGIADSFGIRRNRQLEDDKQSILVFGVFGV